jgi:hypothetical protein
MLGMNYRACKAGVHVSNLFERQTDGRQAVYHTGLLAYRWPTGWPLYRFYRFRGMVLP